MKQQPQRELSCFCADLRHQNSAEKGALAISSLLTVTCGPASVRSHAQGRLFSSWPSPGPCHTSLSGHIILCSQSSCSPCNWFSSPVLVQHSSGCNTQLEPSLTMSAVNHSRRQACGSLPLRQRKPYQAGQAPSWTHRPIPSQQDTLPEDSPALSLNATFFLKN